MTFKERDVDLSELRISLRNGREVDKVLLQLAGVSLDQLDRLTADKAVQGLNAALDMPDLYQRLDIRKLNLSSQTLSVITQGTSSSSDEIRTLNRQILEAVYPHELGPSSVLMFVKRFLRDRHWLNQAKEWRHAFWNLLDKLFLKPPHWKEYLPLSREPYSGTFQSLGKQRRIEFCVEAFMPKTLDHATVLDLGAGNGYSTRLLTQRYPNSQVIGITINRLEWRDARRGGLDMRRADMHALPFADHYFDWVFAIDIFEHTIAPYIALCELNRILKIGAHAVISYPEGEESLKAWYHFNVLEPWQMRILLYKTHLEVVKEEHYTLESGLTHANFVIQKLAHHDSKFPRSYENLNFSEE